jgi:5'-3' exoribonuclease 2
MIMQELGRVEDNIFRDRQRRELDFKARNKAKRRREALESHAQPKWIPQGQFAPMVITFRSAFSKLSKHKKN